MCGLYIDWANGPLVSVMETTIIIKHKCCTILVDSVWETVTFIRAGESQTMSIDSAIELLEMVRRERALGKQMHLICMLVLAEIENYGNN